MGYRPPSKAAERVYKALALTMFDVQPEVSIGGRLRLDFVIKELGVAIEVQGSQHSSFNGFFHDSKYAFKDQQKRDRKKEELCEDTGLTLIQLEERDVLSAPDARALLEFILSAIELKRSEKEDQW